MVLINTREQLGDAVNVWLATNKTYLGIVDGLGQQMFAATKTNFKRHLRTKASQRLTEIYCQCWQ